MYYQKSRQALKRTLFKLRVLYVMHFTKKPFVPVYQKHRRIGKTTYLVKLVEKSKGGILVQGTYPQARYCRNSFPYKNINHMSVQQILRGDGFRPTTMPLYLDETVSYEQYSELEQEHNIKLYLVYGGVK